ncbi:FlxA-like family protein [Chitiniphilus shinanonensis]|nr:FlxA-like family protein [Chitiniphilus shinanonensis]
MDVGGISSLGGTAALGVQGVQGSDRTAQLRAQLVQLQAQLAQAQQDRSLTEEQRAARVEKLEKQIEAIRQEIARAAQQRSDDQETSGATTTQRLGVGVLIDDYA